MNELIALPRNGCVSGVISRRLIQLCCLEVLATLLPPAARAMTFLLTDPAHQWAVTSPQRTAAHHFTIEQVFERTDGAQRIVVVSSPTTPAETESLEDFARGLKRAFAFDAGGDTTNADATRFGVGGRELLFPLTRDNEAFACELFVFAESTKRWGILCAAAQTDPAPPPSLLALLHVNLDAQRTAGVVTLAPYKVKEDAITDFPINFKVIANLATHRVQHLIVSDLPNGVRSRIRVGDEIVTIDGRPSQEFEAAIRKDSELGRIFFNRSDGDEVRLELVSALTHERYEIKLRVNFFSKFFGH